MIPGRIGTLALADPVDDIAEEHYDAAVAGPLHAKACKAGIEASCEQELRIVCSSDPLACKGRCENDDAAACYWLGYSLDRGIDGLAKDAEKGRAFKEKACQLDGEVAEACERLLMNLALEAP